ncbi:MAG TPA: nuclear transport factor 2 family protein [Burkholderiaceae bacterium]
MRLVPILAALVLTACAHQSQLPSGQATGAVAVQRERLNALFSTRHIAQTAELVATDIQFVAPSRATIGTAAFVQSQQSLVQKRPDVVLVFTPDRIEYSESGELAVESGRWHESWRENNERIELSGRYFAVWQAQQGTWLLSSQVFVPLVCRGGSYCQANGSSPHNSSKPTPLRGAA